jgi:crossover junction endodeoxyribonuclease RuvC
MNKNKKIAGIDTGFSGAIAIAGWNFTPVLYDMPTLTMHKQRYIDGYKLKKILLEQSVCHVFIEKAQAMPKQGIVSTARYMKSAGILEGICIGLGLPYTLISPQEWKKKMMPGITFKSKDASVFRVKQLFPNINLEIKKDHHKCEALLLALYGLTQAALLPAVTFESIIYNKKKRRQKWQTMQKQANANLQRLK